MQVLVFSDVHGNLPALEYLVKKNNSADMIISLGDVVNYGPWSNECVDLLDSIENKITLMGNHEEFFINGNYPGTNIIAQTFFKFCYPTFSRHKQIEDYVPTFELDECRFIHTIDNEYIFPDTDVEIGKDTFIGHSHRLFKKDVNGYRLVNVGSVGQNRKNIDEVNYVLWNVETNEVELFRDYFSSDLLINEMKAKNYPDICLNYILSKKINYGE